MSLRQRLFPPQPSLAIRLARWPLRLVSLPYALCMRLRNLAYDLGILKSYSVDIPVICVGNLSVGGTGKTPMVAWICSWLRERNVRVAIVSRGYGQLESGSNDEALELELALPDVPHLQNPDRYAAAKLAQEELDMQVVVLDDGFQHRRLKRDLDIVLLDMSEPAAADWCLPGGLMREPLSGLKRADIVLATRIDQADFSRLAKLQSRAARLAPGALQAPCFTKPVGWHGMGLPFKALTDLKGKSVLAFCGIGNPNAFFHTLEQLGVQVVGQRIFEDHHAFSAEDVEQLSQWTDANPGISAIVCTMKDWVKLQTPRLGATPLAALKIGVSFGEKQVELEKRLDQLLS